MPTRLTLICHGATRATRTAAFARDEALEAKAVARAERLAPTLPRCDRALTSPARRARETAASLGLAATIDDDLRDLDVGRWAGLSLAVVADQDPEALAAWLADPTVMPHGGEPVVALIARVAAWLDSVAQADTSVIAVTHPAIIRAAILHALGAPPAGFWRIDVAPLSWSEMYGRAGRWTLRSTGRRRPAGDD